MAEGAGDVLHLAAPAPGIRLRVPPRHPKVLSRDIPVPPHDRTCSLRVQQAAGGPTQHSRVLTPFSIPPTPPPALSRVGEEQGGTVPPIAPGDPPLLPRGWAGSHCQLRCRPDPGHKSSPKVQQALEADLILISFSPLKIEPLIPSSKHSPTLSPPPFSLSLPVPPPVSHWGEQGSATSSVIICPLPCNFFFPGK